MGLNDSRSAERVSALSPRQRAWGEGDNSLTRSPEEFPRIMIARKGSPSSPLSLRERGLEVRAKISEAGHRVLRGSRVRSSVRPTMQYPHPALSRRERVVYTSDRSFTASCRIRQP